MKCPFCKTWTTVLETRTRSDGVMRRRYVCANMHRFTTHEIVVRDQKQIKEDTWPPLSNF